MEVFCDGDIGEEARRHHTPSQFVRELSGVAVQKIHAVNVQSISAGLLFHGLDTGREHAGHMVKRGMGRMLMLDNTTECGDFRECFGL
jgi:hypothetical protein